jgi:hypothetical protein
MWEGYLASLQVRVGSADRWLSGDDCYSTGWALGRLHHVTAAQIQAEYNAGTLRHDDILATDGVPAEVPFVAGILSLSPSTPNSHVAILARSYGVPFAYARRAELQASIQALEGQDVVLRADNNFGQGCRLRVDALGSLSTEQKDALRALKQPLPVNYVPKATRGSISSNVDTLMPTDVRHFGGKATHFALLRTAIPEASEPAVAFSFDLWDAFMAQELTPGTPLRQEIATQLAAFTWPPDTAAVTAALAGIRTRVESGSFTPSQQQAILTALSSFNPTVKLRFRSSTNVEDSDSFTGAGLYESFSGCVADDADADTTGPSACDATQAQERGAFRALRKVYASFYNDNAYLERLRRGVNESQVAMGVLCHRSSPDAQEMANGVATVEVGLDSKMMTLVTQQGAVSVSNPEGGAVPEIVSVWAASFGTYPSDVQASSLVPLGGHVLEWDAEYLELAGYLAEVADLYRTTYGRAPPFTLDFEYRKREPGDLEVKQVRPLPTPDTSGMQRTFLVGTTQTLCTFQGESGDIMAVHRTKARLGLTTRSTWLDAPGVASSFYSAVNLQYVDGTTVATLSGDPATLPGAAHSAPTATEVRDAFTLPYTGDDAVMTLQSNVVAQVPGAAIPVVTAEDFYFYSTVRHAADVPFVDWDGMVAMRRDDTAALAPCPPTGPVAGESEVRRQVTLANNVQLDIRFVWPPAPTGVVAGYTAPLQRWTQTTITGLTAQPIVLHGEWSQSYRPGHHNFNEDFVFEPRLEPGLSAAILAELVQKDIAALQVHVDGGNDRAWVVGLNGQMRAY